MILLCGSDLMSDVRALGSGMLYRCGAIYRLFLAVCIDFLILYLHSNFSKQDGKFAMGFSGDIDGGGKTAYDVLPPKPWKAAP